MAGVLLAALDRAWLMATPALAGVSCRLADGKTELTEETYQMAIEGALADVGGMLDVVLLGNESYGAQGTHGPAEGHDIIDLDAIAGYHTNLRRKPLIGVTRLAIAWNNAERLQIPLSWLQVKSQRLGQIALEASGEPIVTLGSYQYLRPAGNWGSNAFRVSYVAGYERALTGTVEVVAGQSTVTGTGTSFTTELRPGVFVQVGAEARRVLSVTSPTSARVGRAWGTSAAGESATVADVPPEIVEMVSLAASLPTLVALSGRSPLGDGISNLSVSTEGFSESMGTFVNGQTLLHNARIEANKKLLAEKLAVHKRRHRKAGSAIV